MEGSEFSGLIAFVHLHVLVNAYIKHTAKQTKLALTIIYGLSLLNKVLDILIGKMLVLTVS